MPDKAPVLEARWRDAIAAAAESFPGLPLFIGGKSMGGRIASQVAAQDHPGIAGLVCLGYPLHPPGKPSNGAMRICPASSEPMLFVQGTRDAFGTGGRDPRTAPTTALGTTVRRRRGDHSFKIGGKGAPSRRPCSRDFLTRRSGGSAQCNPFALCLLA